MKQHGSGVESEAEREFYKRCDDVRALLARADRDEVRARYEVGVIVVLVRDKAGKYGEKSVERLAAEVHRDAARG